MQDEQGRAYTITGRSNLTTRRNICDGERGGLKLLRMAISLLMVIVLYPALARGQATQGSLNGLVKDPQNLPSPGASITAKNLQTNEQFTSKTNDQGVFELPSLPPGRYSVIVELKGFKKTEIQSVIVETARPSHIDVNLVVSQLTEEITVK